MTSSRESQGDGIWEPHSAGRGTPKVTILLAVYRPPRKWLGLLLDSLNRQDYPNLELLVRDDASPGLDFKELDAFLAQHITAFPYHLSRNETNTGSTAAFQRLTQDARGDYVCYCDQDDLWDQNKISLSLNTLRRERALLVCGDARVIDGDGRPLADSLEKFWKRFRLKRGRGLAQAVLSQNFVVGCTALLPRDTAQAACPFIPGMVHDQWLGIYAALRGKIAVYPGQLLSYRAHGKNQTGSMAGILCKRDYLEKRIVPFRHQMEEILRREDFPAASRYLAWTCAREAYFRDGKGARTLLRLRDCGLGRTLFELVIRLLPEPFFRLAAWLAKRRFL